MVKIHDTGRSAPRLYRGVGGAVPSVTEVIKLLQRHDFREWRNKVGRKKADLVIENARTLGTKVHAVAHAVALGSKGPKDPAMEPFHRAIDEFFGLHVAEVLAVEKTLISHKERVGGTLDLYARLNDGSFAVVDFKTSRATDRVMGVQTALYALLLREAGHTVNKRMIVRLKKKPEEQGKWHARVYADHERDVRAGRAAVELWHWQHSKKLGTIT